MGARVPSEAMPPVGNMMGEYFEEFGTASPSDVRRWIVATFQARLRGTAIPTEAGEARAEELAEQVPTAVSYRGIVNRFYWMRELGLIEYAYSEPFRGFDKNFYKAVEGREDDIRGGAQFNLYPDLRWGGDRYKRAREEGLLTPGRAPDWTPSDVARAPLEGRPRHGPGGRERQAGVGETGVFVPEEAPVSVGFYFGDKRNALGAGQRYYGPFETEAEARYYADFTEKPWDIREFSAEDKVSLSAPTGQYVFYEPDMGQYEELDIATGALETPSYEALKARLEEEDES